MSTEGPPLGKFGRERLEKYVFPHLKETNLTEVGPRFGSDFNSLELDNEKVLIVSTDPLAISPQLGWKRSGRLALQVITADVAVSGISPGYLVVNWNLPPTTSDETFEKIWRGFTEEANRINVTIIGGHTGRYEGSSFPTVGAGTAIGLGEKERLIPNNPSPGDKIYLLNRIGLEAAAIFCFYYPNKISSGASNSVVTSVKRKFDNLEPTGDLDFLASLPGVTALHDVAEGGLLGGLQEMLAEKDHGAIVRKNRVKVDREVSRICRQLNLDPLRITSIGSGIALISPDREEEFSRRVGKKGLPVTRIGEITRSEDISLETNEGTEVLKTPVRDRFWKRLSELEVT